MSTNFGEKYDAREKGEKGKKGEERGRKRERKINKGKNYDRICYIRGEKLYIFPQSVQHQLGKKIIIQSKSKKCEQTKNKASISGREGLTFLLPTNPHFFFFLWTLSQNVLEQAHTFFFQLNLSNCIHKKKIIQKDFHKQTALKNYKFINLVLLSI